MLIELHIENFAIIDRLDLSLESGLVTFTGETGAGKSIIIDAVETLLGGRAEAGLVRSGAERAGVEGVFTLPAARRQEVLAILEREDLLDDPDQVTLGREIRSNGRSVARLNGRSVSAALLREIGEFLVDVHGQSEHLSLLRVNHHLDLLDAYAAADGEYPAGSLLDTYRQHYTRWQAARRALNELRQSERDAARRADMLTYQVQEIETARLHPGEEEELKAERNRLANAEGLAAAVQQALVLLDDGSPETPAITDLLGQVTHALAGLARLDPARVGLSEQAETLSDSLVGLIDDLRSYQEGIEFNPRRLDQVEERLDLIRGLKRKYGDTIPAILAFAEEARRQLEAITHAGERITELEAELGQHLQALGQVGVELSHRRRVAAEKLSHCIDTELADLHMSGAHFSVDFQQRPDPEGVSLDNGQRVGFDANGLERVEFLIAPNPGEGFKPLARIASGGETSRLMLALKNVLAHADQVPTLIFDEIDQGIGGRVGVIVGQKLYRLARQHQVLCITHLPQLAAFGEQHYHVQKRIQDGRTSTQVRCLQGEERITELAQMMGSLSESTLHSARELVQRAAQGPDQD